MDPARSIETPDASHPATRRERHWSPPVVNRMRVPRSTSMIQMSRPVSDAIVDGDAPAIRRERRVFVPEARIEQGRDTAVAVDAQKRSVGHGGVGRQIHERPCSRGDRRSRPLRTATSRPARATGWAAGSDRHREARTASRPARQPAHRRCVPSGDTGRLHRRRARRRAASIRGWPE